MEGQRPSRAALLRSEGEGLDGALLGMAPASPPGSVQVMHRKVQSVRAGGNVTFSCRSVTKEDVLQVTWQKETDGAEDNIATYSMINGQKIAKGYVGHVSFSHSELQASSISLHGVTLQDEGCYKCIFNTFPSGAVTGRMSILDHRVEAKLIPSPDKAENSEKLVGISCSATGKPAPKITWHLPSILQQKPKEYHIKLGNQTVTVISNFTHTHSKILHEYPIACMIQHPSLNVTLVLPTDSLVQDLLLTCSTTHHDVLQLPCHCKGLAGFPCQVARHEQDMLALGRLEGLGAACLMADPKHRSAGGSPCVCAGMCSQCPCPLHLTQGTVQGMSEVAWGWFYFLHALTEYLLLSPQIRTAAWHRPLSLQWGCWSP
uniref:Ig-like domain-containing protein n=1 Tax=Athene cunicularia TaxID=194338 RepID=A0A663NCX1_ATHCN